MPGPAERAANRTIMPRSRESSWAQEDTESSGDEYMQDVWWRPALVHKKFSANKGLKDRIYAVSKEELEPDMLTQKWLKKVKAGTDVVKALGSIHQDGLLAISNNIDWDTVRCLIPFRSVL